MPKLPTWINVELHWTTPKNPTTQVHQHDWHELILVRQGRYRVRVGPHQLTLDPEQGVYYPPGLKHRPTGEPTYRTQFYLLLWHGGDNASLPAAPTPFRDLSGRIAAALAWVWELHLAQHPERLTAAQGLWLAVREELKSLAQPALHARKANAVGVVREVIHDLAGQPLTRQELAARVGLTGPQLARQFQRQTGLPPMQYLQQVRLNLAARLLLTTELPLKAIAERTGLGSSAYLCRLFRRAYGQAPIQYRRKLTAP